VVVLQATFFGVDEYSYDSMTDVFKRIQGTWKGARIKCAIWNTAQWWVSLLSLEVLCDC